MDDERDRQAWRRSRVVGAGERLVVAGATALSDAELLGMVLDGGIPTAAGRLRAEGLLLEVGGIARLHRLDARDVDGGSAALVRAAVELGRRAAGAPLTPGRTVRDAAAIHAHFCGRLPQLDRERFYAVLLDGRNRLQAEVRVSEGSLTTALVHPREVFAPAIRAAAAALVLVHNHPSGDPTPSAEDSALTERLRQVGELIGIRVLDHVVIGQGRYVSMAEEGRW